MSSGRGGGKPSSKVEQLSHGVADISLDSAQDDGEWEVYAKKSKNRAGSSAAKQWGSQNANPRAWGNPNTVQKQGVQTNGGPGRASGNSWPTQTADSKRSAGRGNARSHSSTRGYDSNYTAPQPAPQPVIPPPLQHGWNWRSIANSTQSKGSHGQGEESHPSDDVEADKNGDVDEDDDDSDVMEESDDDLLSDEYDSDASQKSHNTRKTSKWFRKFFGILDNLSIEEINDPERQWHCPACQGGPGSIDWYRGLQPLMTHAKTKGSKRVKTHRELAELLEEELHQRGTSVIPAGEIFGKWKGLKVDEKDHEIVWPPMVVIMNTKLEQDENDKWIGMGNQELLDYFSSYAAAKARHSYGPQGHRGMSLLIFEASARGYLEAERLHKHFAGQGTDRNAWDRGRGSHALYHSGGERQLFGYMALKEDLDVFNQHSQGKSKLKYDLRSYQEMVVKQIKLMSEENQQLNYFKNKVVKEHNSAKAYKQSFNIVSEKLRKTIEENRIVRQRTKMQHEENKEEMYLQEQFFKDQIQIIRESRDEKEEDFERLQQEEREKVKESNANPRGEEIAKFIANQDKEMEDFVGERDKLTEAHKEKMAAMRKRHGEEAIELEKEYDAELTRLMDEYSPHRPKDAANSS